MLRSKSLLAINQSLPIDKMQIIMLLRKIMSILIVNPKGVWVGVVLRAGLPQSLKGHHKKEKKKGKQECERGKGRQRERESKKEEERGGQEKYRSTVQAQAGVPGKETSGVSN